MSIHSRYLQSVLLAITMAYFLAVVGCGGGSSSFSNSPSPEDISGTGKDISGTGITTGTVDGFGSVIVNGTHFDTEGTEFSIDDTLGAQSDLSVGQVVTIIGSVENGEGTAVSISYEQNLEGPISSVDSGNERFVALGQTIIVNDLTVFDNTSLATLASGQYIEVSGVNDAEGNIRASYVGLRNEADAMIELRGGLSNLDTENGSFYINNLLVSYGDTTNFDINESLHNGLFVEVAGELLGSTLEATKIEEKEEEHDEDEELEIEGFVTNVAIEISRFNVAGITVQYSGDTEFENGTIMSIALNVALEVEGIVNADGILEASEIEFVESVSIEFEGQVQAVDLESSTLMVLGLIFTVDVNTRIRDERDDIQLFSLSNISIDDYVKIKAFESTSNQYVAVGLERTETETDVELEASIESINVEAQSIMMLGVTVDLSNPELEIEDMTKDEFFATISVGDVVEVEGVFDEGTLIAFEIELEDDEEDSMEENMGLFFDTQKTLMLNE